MKAFKLGGIQEVVSLPVQLNGFNLLVFVQ